VNAPKKNRPLAIVIEAAASYAIGLACLWRVFHKLPLRPFLRSLAGLNVWLLAVGGALALAAYLCVAWEWQFLLRPVGRLPFWKAARAVLGGRFANDVLPLHVGCVARILLAGRWLRASVAALAPSLIVERLWDGLWLVVGTTALSFAAPLPPEVLRARNFLAVLVLAGIAAAGAVFLRRSPATDSRPGILGRIKLFFDNMAAGTRGLVRARVLAPVMVLSLLKLAVQAAAILVLLRACHIQLPLAAGLGVFVAGYLAVCVPAAPAGAGLFQLFVAGFLGFCGIDKAPAASFSLVSFVALTLPPALAGFFALAGSGISLRRLRQSAANLTDSASGGIV
jgi:uncharacterized membrane protein YbhN (UPF0104 family)